LKEQATALTVSNMHSIYISDCHCTPHPVCRLNIVEGKKPRITQCVSITVTVYIRQ